MRGGEMRGNVTPTASKLEGGAKRAHKTVFFDIGRVYVVVEKHSHSLTSVRFTENSNWEMRDSVTSTASKLEGGAKRAYKTVEGGVKRAHKTVFFDIKRVYMRRQVCVCNISLA